MESWGSSGREVRGSLRAACLPRGVDSFDAMQKLTRGPTAKKGFHVRITAKTDYALRALIELAKDWQHPLGSEEIAQAQQIPHKYLEAILSELRRTGFVISQRGASGGHSLRGRPSEISIADVIRAVNGPLTIIRGECPEDVDYVAAEALQLLWIALRVSIRSVLEEVTLADIAACQLPAAVAELTESPDAWVTHWFQPGKPSPKRQEFGS